MTTTFERGFAGVERSAIAAAKTSGAIVAAAKQLQRAAQEGDINKLRKAAERLSAATDAARQDIANAKTAWPFGEQEEKAYLADAYQVELLEEAERAGLTIQARDARLIAFPSILQLLPTDLAVRVDRKRVTAIRPSHLVRTLLANQSKKARYPSERFLEALYSAYRLIAGPDGGGPILLSRVYQAFTLQPGAAAEYDKGDFARDIFMLDRSGVTRTRRGFRLSLPAVSTGTRVGSSDVFTFVAPDGELVRYHGLQFTEE